MKMKITIFVMLFLTCVTKARPQLTQAQKKGKEIFEQQGCLSCHGPQTIQGPRLQNLHGSLVKLSSGEVIKADEIYLKSSIYNPKKHIVNGFGPLMPSYKSLLNEEDLHSLVQYLKSL